MDDANKNVTDYVDASGTIQAHYEYSPFGKIAAKSGPMDDDFEYRFSSEYLDSETGLVYYNYRYYSPELGRWLSRDPIEELGGNNLYSFCYNDAISNLDTNGEGVIILGVLIAAIILWGHGDIYEPDQEIDPIKFLELILTKKRELKQEAPIIYKETKMESLFRSLMKVMANNHMKYYANPGSGAVAQFEGAYFTISGTMRIPLSTSVDTILHEISHANVYFNNLGYDWRRDEGLAYSINHAFKIIQVFSVMDDNIKTGFKPARGFKELWDNSLEAIKVGIGEGFKLDKTDYANRKKHYGFCFNCEDIAEVYKKAIKKKFNIDACLDCEVLKGTPLETP